MLTFNQTPQNNTNATKPIINKQKELHIVVDKEEY